jgi:hypothetical protein
VWPDAHCLGLTELFFPDVLIGRRPANLYDVDVATAKMVCAGCPYTHACLLIAYRGAERFGVWGGVNWANASERRKARRLIRERVAA